jgi:hypothetical protein
LLFLKYKGTTYKIWGCSNIIWSGFQWWCLKLRNVSNLRQVTKMCLLIFVSTYSIYFCYICIFRSQISIFINLFLLFYFESLYCPYFVRICFATRKIIIVVLFLVFIILIILESLYIYLDCVTIASDYDSLIFTFERIAIK